MLCTLRRRLRGLNDGLGGNRLGRRPGRLNEACPLEGGRAAHWALGFVLQKALSVRGESAFRVCARCPGRLGSEAVDIFKT